MFSMEGIIGTLFSATVVRLASMGFAIWVGLTLGGEVIDYLTNASNALQAAIPMAH